MVIKKYLGYILLALIVMNFTFDLIINWQILQTLGYHREISEIHQKVLLRHEANITEMVEYHEEMARLYYNVAYVCVNTQLKCNIFYDELIRANPMQETSKKVGSENEE